MNNLYAELREAAFAVKPIHLRHLVSLGVDWPIIADMGRDHHPFGIDSVTSIDDGLYIRGEGRPHLVVPIYQDGELVDLAAFRTTDPGNWLLRTGAGWSLGLGHGLEPHTWSPTTALHADPLMWMRAGCEGLVVLDWGCPEVRQLTALPSIVCPNQATANLLRTALTRPSYLPQILVEEYRHAA